MNVAIIQKSFQGIDDLQLEELNDPNVTSLSAIVKNQYTPIMPWDWLTEEGKLKDLNPVQLPRIIGYAFAGIVEEVGSFRDQHLLGQAVIGAQLKGSNQLKINSQIPPLLFRVPKGIDLTEAATIIGGADAALLAIKASKIQPQDNILVTGATGGVGTYIIQLLKYLGAKVIAIARLESMQFAEELGADYIIDRTNDLSIQLAEVPIPSKVIDVAGSISLLNQISLQLDELKIFSLALTNYQPLKHEQTFSFSNQNIGLKGYHQLLELLSKRVIRGVTQEIFDYKDVKKAQWFAKTTPSKGRTILKY